MTTPDMLAGISLPTTTVLKPPDTAYEDVEEWMLVTQGPRRTESTISLPMGVLMIQVDFSFENSTAGAGLRLFRNAVVTHPLANTPRGKSTQYLRIVNDDPGAWICVTTRLNNVPSRAQSRVGVTIQQMGDISQP